MKFFNNEEVNANFSENAESHPMIAIGTFIPGLILAMGIGALGGATAGELSKRLANFICEKVDSKIMN